MDPLHLLPLSVMVIPIIWGIYGYYHSKKHRLTATDAEGVTTSNWPLIINSAVLYALAFNLIFFIQELFLALGKRWLGLKAYLYHNNHGWDGEHPQAALAQGYGAASIFICAVIFLLLARRVINKKHWMQVFFLWLAFQGFAQSLPQFITAMMAPDTDTGQAFTYLGISRPVGLLISLASIILLLLTSMAYSQYLLEMAPSGANTKTAGKRFRYLLRIAGWAAIIGLIFITPFRIMPWSRAAAPVFVTLFAVPMILANSWKVENIQTVNNEINRKIFPGPIIALLAVLLIFQLILAKGIEM